MTVLSGLDSLASSDFSLLKGRRVGLVTNPSALSRTGASAIETLYRAPQVRLVALFGPEHGVRGDVPAGKAIGDARDPKTGLPAYSLYGATKVPTAAMLKGLDALVFDLQDIGSRSYTFLSTLGCVLEGSARHGVPVVVLDRPNPCGLTALEGGPVRPGFFSFVSKYAVGYLHGLTLGEAAKMLVGEGWLPGSRKPDLTVVACPGLTRAFSPWTALGLPWRAPSPNVPKAETALYYAATGIVGELDCLSIGVGTETPFELAGAPGIDGARMATYLDGLALPGFAFAPANWTPSHGVFSGQRCSGVRLTLPGPERATLTAPNWALLAALQKQGVRDPFRDAEARHLFDLDCGTDAIRKAFLKGASVKELTALFDQGLPRFAQQRQRYLLYR